MYIVGKQRKDHKSRSLNYCFFANQRVLFFAILPGSQRLCANGPFEDCQVRMFVKQPNRRLQQLLAVENKTILQQLKPSPFYIMFHLTLIFCPITLACVHKCFTQTGHLKSAKNECFVKQRRTHGLSTYLLSKKIFMLKQKSSNLYMIGFKSARKFLSDCLSALH